MIYIADLWYLVKVLLCNHWNEAGFVTLTIDNAMFTQDPKT